MLYNSMRHRTQLYLDEDQHRWLRQRAGRSGSIAAVVRELIDRERTRRRSGEDDPLIRYLLEDPPASGSGPSTVTDVDRDLYGN
jgi:hypothetical protein